jgi:glycogen phosphorylase
MESEVVPAFSERDRNGLPRAWLERMRVSLRTLAPAFGTDRMLDDCLRHVYTAADPSPVHAPVATARPQDVLP